MNEPTRLSAPARELNRVAVTTLFFLGSTAPIATSGVSTIATSFGGAVKIVARPKCIGNNGVDDPDADPGPPTGVLIRGLLGTEGVFIFKLMLSRPFPEVLVPLAFDNKEGRRDFDVECEVEREDVDLARPERVRTLGTEGLWLEPGDMAMGDETRVVEEDSESLDDGGLFGSLDSSCHCKCRITDLVAHWCNR